MRFCYCFHAHGVDHVCDHCYDKFMEFTPLRAWVEAERCRVCVMDEVEKLESKLVQAKQLLRMAQTPRGIDGIPIPARFLTVGGWESGDAIRPEGVEFKP